MCAKPLSRPQCGVSLVELIVAIVVISVSLVGVYSVFNLTLLHSADPLVQKQMISIAEGLMDEVLLKNFDDPNGECTASTTPRCTPNTLSDRPNYNDVSDYAGFTMNGIYALDGTAISGLSGYTVNVAVDATTASLGGLSGSSQVKRIAITVSNGRDSFVLEGYRTAYDG